jgi:ACS family pantothenate transporter-like MFS transporter
VLLIGGGVSALDIAKEISITANKIYQSTRNGAFDLPETALPSNAQRIGEIGEFNISTSVDSNEHLPLTAHLKSGETLDGIDTIILCTGYQMAVPFLDEFNDHSVSAFEANDTVLVTDGTQVHNLHEDIFYIPDPTLAFVGIPFYTATFSLFEFQAIAVAAFLSGIAQLPSTEKLRAEYEDRVKTKGYGRSFHSLKEQEQPYVKKLIEWVNVGRVENGLPLIEGHTEAWVQERAALGERLKLILAGQLPRADVFKSPLEVRVSA